MAEGEALKDAVTTCGIRSWYHFKDEMREHGFDPNVAHSHCRVVSEFKPYCSSYRLLLEVHYKSSRLEFDRRYYFLLSELWDKSFRTDDLQIIG